MRVVTHERGENPARFFCPIKRRDQTHRKTGIVMRRMICCAGAYGPRDSNKVFTALLLEHILRSLPERLLGRQGIDNPAYSLILCRLVQQP